MRIKLVSVGKLPTQIEAPLLQGKVLGGRAKCSHILSRVSISCYINRNIDILVRMAYQKGLMDGKRQRLITTLLPQHIQVIIVEAQDVKRL